MPLRLKFRFGASTTVLDITQNFFFREVASNHFKQKNINVDLDEYCFKVPNYDFFLDMNDSVNDYLEVAWVFQDRENDDVIPPLMLIRNAEKSDAVQRENSIIDPTQEASLCIWAWKRGSSAGGILAGFKRRYFVLQSNTLYYSESPGGNVLGYIPCCGLHLSLRPDITYKDKIVFEITTVFRGARSYILAADQLEFGQLQQTIDELQLRRVKSCSVTICQALLRRGVDTMQGLFRLSGEKSQVEYLRHQYELSLDPDLTELPNETLAGVVKLYLRQLEVPIISFGLYSEFLRIGKLSPGIERTEAANIALSRLPLSQHAFLHYLCSFLYKVSQFSTTNLMTSKNLAIVIGPNLLRPQRETTQTAMADNKYVLSVVQLLIDQQSELFGPTPQLTVPDTTETQQFIRQRASTVSAQAAALSLTSSAYKTSTAAPVITTTITENDLGVFNQPTRASRQSISQIDPSYGFVQDLKNAMNSATVLGNKIEILNTKHQAIMQRWQELIGAIKNNPSGTYPLLEFILSQSDIDTRWLDSGISRLDQVNNNLSELVELLGPTQQQQQQQQQHILSSSISSSSLYANAGLVHSPSSAALHSANHPPNAPSFPQSGSFRAHHAPSIAYPQHNSSVTSHFHSVQPSHSQQQQNAYNQVPLPPLSANPNVPPKPNQSLYATTPVAPVAPVAPTITSNIPLAPAAPAIPPTVQLPTSLSTVSSTSSLYSCPPDPPSVPPSARVSAIHNNARDTESLAHSPPPPPLPPRVPSSHSLHYDENDVPPPPPEDF